MSGPSGSIDGQTRLACIIGHPVDHSLSPLIHNAAFAATGLNWRYLAFDVQPGSLSDAITGLRALNVAGANVTMPHKQAVIELVDEITDDARAIGAINTIARSEDDELRLVGYNTDGEGFLRFLSGTAGVQPAGSTVLLLGAGGSARALSVALGHSGASVVVSARRHSQAQHVALLGRGTAVGWESRNEAAQSAHVIVNATPVSMAEPTPSATDNSELLQVSSFHHGHVVVDLAYVPAESAFLANARKAGANPFNGIGMLVAQAALSFTLWTGIAAPEKEMAAVIEDALTL
ncbi:MAG: shikimate dehydrogenase [Actinomycetota bacterium]